MKKIYNEPEELFVYVTSESMLAVSIPGESDGGFADRYDTAPGRRPWGDVWSADEE